MELFARLLVLALHVGPYLADETASITAKYWLPNVSNSGKVVKFGTPLSMDSDDARYTLGMAMRNSFELYFDWLFENRGGVKINGEIYGVELLMAEDGSSKSEVTRLTTYLIDRLGVDLLLAPYSSGLTGMAAEIVHARGKTMVAAGSSSITVFDGRPSVFGTLSPSNLWLETTFAALVDAGASGASMALVQEDVKWTRGICGQVEKRGSAFGMTLNQSITVPKDANQSSAALAVGALKAANFDILFACVYRKACHSLLREAKAQRYSPKAMVFTVCVTESDFIQELGVAGEYVIGMAPWTPDLPLGSSLTDFKVQSWVADYKARTGGVPPYQAASAFASVAVYVNAIETSNSTDPALVAKTLKDIGKDTIFGKVSFDKNGQCQNPMKVVQSQFTSLPNLVWPQNQYANGKLVYPKPGWAQMECFVLEDTQSSSGLDELGKCRPCLLGQASVLDRARSARVCQDCAKGQFGSPDRACEDCRPGTFQESNGSTACDACGLGRFSNASARTACELCPKGTAALTGQSSCEACLPGHYTKQDGATECLRCNRATYRSANDSSCIDCPSGTTTVFMGAVASSDCVCDMDSFLPVGGGTCLPCPTGMKCEVGSDMAYFHAMEEYTSKEDADRPFPLLAQGYYSSFEEPLSVFKCLIAENCPGGVAGTCAGGRVDISCSRCPDGEYVKAGICSSCGQSFAWLVILLLCAVACIVLAIGHVGANWPMVRGNQLVMTSVLFCGMGVTVVLTFGIYGTFDVVWVSPLSDFIPSFSVFRLDLDMLLNFACVVGRSSYVAEYVVRLFLFPIAVMCLIIGVRLLHLLPRARPFSNMSMPALQNTAGYLMSALFVSVSLMSSEGLRCQLNPNGKSTLMADESIVCWEGGTHTLIVVLSVVAVLLYPVLFLSLTGYAIFSYHSLCMRYGISCANRLRFLTSRMKPEYIFFSYALHVRNFVISFVPVLTNRFEIQIILIISMFLGWLVLQTKTQCWRFEALNTVDTLVSAVQVIMLCLFGFLAGAVVEENIVGWCIIGLLSVSVLTLGVMAAHRLYLQFRKRVKYDVFLSHHKAAAGLFARHLKYVFQSYGRDFNVFLDVDELDDLDQLAFAIKRTKHLTVILTSDVLRRPWCAVEICVAYLNKVPIDLVTINSDKDDLSDEQQKSIISDFTEQDIATFAQNGFTLDDLSETYSHLSKLPIVRVPLNSTNEVLPMDAMQAVADTLGPAKAAKRKSIIPIEHGKSVYIMYNTCDNKQCSVASILHHLFRASRWDAQLLGPTDTAVQAPDVSSSAVVVALISEGLPRDPIALGASVAVKRAGLRVVTVRSQEAFAPLSEDTIFGLSSLKLLSSHQISIIRQWAPHATGQEIVDSLLPLYKILAWHFGPEQNESLLNQEFSVVLQRVEKARVQHMSILESGSWRGSGDSKCPVVVETNDEAKASSPITSNTIRYKF